MKACKYFLLLLIAGTVSVFSQSGYYPPPSSVIFHNDTLTIYPPDSLPGEPVELLGYNVYVDSVFFDNIMEIDPAEPIDYLFERPGLLPGNHAFCAKAFYNEWISEAACDSGQVIYGFELPFLENWSSGGFEENLWVSTSGNWVVEEEDGNPAPAVQFKGDPGQTDYVLNLESYPVNAVGMSEGNIWLDYDLKLDDTESTGNEWLRVQVWNWSNNTWITVADYSNEDGSFNWVTGHINIKSVAMNKVFKVRFHASGINSSDIQAWLIDNIHIYRKCDGPVNLVLEENENQNVLDWDGPGPWYYTWIHWDDGVNAGNSIGTGGAVEFDVAARWTAEQLAEYDGAAVYEIAFFPAEQQAIYYVRVWAGEGPDTLVFEQIVESPIIGAWNYVALVDPIFLDITQDLWVGYHVNTPTGYPAGVDDGPGINGSGNMMFFQGEWKTLLEINPELDFNWNIACLIEASPYGQHLYYNLYRETNQGGFQLYHKVYNTVYHDYNIIPSENYCYKLTKMVINNGDTCESDPTNTVCETVTVGFDPPETDAPIKIYPNPTNHFLNIESEEVLYGIKIYNPIGELVLNLEKRNLDYKIDVNHFPEGVYYVKIGSERREFTAKIIVLK